MTGSQVEPTVHFRGGKQERQALSGPLPRNTLDPRYGTCAHHHTACICREAEFAEELTERRMETKELRRLVERLIELIPPDRLARELEQLLWIENFHKKCGNGRTPRVWVPGAEGEVLF